MALTTSTKRLPTPERGLEDRIGGRVYEVVFEVDQTDAGSRAAGVAVVIAAQTAGQLPLKGDDYSYDGFTDLDSYLQEIEWFRPEPVNRERRWHVACRYTPLEGIGSGTIIEPNPLLWPVEYWMEWTEEQIVLEEAKNVEELLFIFRGAGTLGPIVNACGQEFTEPLMKTIYYPVLHAQKAYSTLTEIFDLNFTYQGTTNNGTYFDQNARTWKYLSTESGRIQQVNGQSFYMGVTRLWFRPPTWDRKVLNNGWNHFEYEPGSDPLTILYHPDSADPLLFKNMVADHTAQEVFDGETDVDNIASSEPLNLTLDGTLQPKDEDGIYISYRDLDEVDYIGIGIGG